MYTDLDDVGDKLEEIKHAIVSLEKTVADSSTASIISRVFWVWLVIAAIFEFGGQILHSSWRYSIQYDVSHDKVHIQKKPHDCDLFSAPIGEKYCTYKVSVSTLRWARSTSGNPILSMDDGKTWEIFTPDAGQNVPQYSTVEEVSVGWVKSEEDD